MTSIRDRGSTTILMAVLMLISLSMTAHIATVGRTAIREALVQSIADVTALAGVVGSRSIAERIARDNGADLVVFEQSREVSTGGSVVHVVVAFGDRQASAWASDAQ